jgi:hypothetical protein
MAKARAAKHDISHRQTKFQHHQEQAFYNMGKFGRETYKKLASDEVKLLSTECEKDQTVRRN